MGQKEMASDTSLPPLPQIALFPKASWRAHMVPEEWAASLDAWILLVEAHLSLSISDFQIVSAKDDSISAFLLSYMSEAALSPDIASFVDPLRWKNLWKRCFLLVNRLLHIDQPLASLLKWEFLADFCKVYGKARCTNVIESLWSISGPVLEGTLTALKISLVENLYAGVNGSPQELDQTLKHLNYLIFCSPSTASFFMTGADFLDGLVSCYKLMNPPLRKTIISITYLSILGLAEGSSPNLSLLIDQLYSLKAAANSHKAGLTNENDSLVAELVTVTPFLGRIQRYLENNGTLLARAKSVISSLKGFRKAGGKPKMLFKRRIGGEELPAPIGDGSNPNSNGDIHIHRMSLITQVQDLFPDLGSGFVMKLLDEYNEDVEQVISHLLEENRGESLPQMNKTSAENLEDLAPRLTPPLVPVRRNVFDNDEFDQLTVDTSRLNFGKKNPEKTADDILRDTRTAPNKAAILSALAAFDSDDDERDDTYDVEDVGGTVDSATPGNNPEEASAASSDMNEEALFRAFKMNLRVFDRDAATRRSKPRIALREATGITDEAIEGWALMFSRDPQRIKRLETRFLYSSGARMELESSAWKADLENSSADDSDSRVIVDRGVDKGPRGRGGYRRGRRGRDGSVAGPAGEKETGTARQRKEANKGSRANHNRRDQRARKMARGGFQALPP